MPYYKQYNDNYRIQNREKFREYSKTFREKHGPRILTEEEKERQKEYRKEYGLKNREALREKKKLQIANNPEYAASLRLSKRNWNAANKQKITDYHRNRKQTDIAYRLKCYLRTRLYQVLKRKKDKSALELLGCTADQFQLFISFKFIVGMSWDNYGEWELDHIKPLSLFNLFDKEEQSKAFHFTNFQPLWKADNRSKRDKYDYR